MKNISSMTSLSISFSKTFYISKLKSAIEFFSGLCTLFAIVFAWLIRQALAILRFAIKRFWRWQKRLISKHRYRALIEKKSSKFIFGKVARPRLVDCIICLSKFEEGEEIRELECEHCFHKDCLDRWLHHDLATCPLCRKRVLPEEIVAEHRRIQSEDENSSDADEMLTLLYGMHDRNLHRSHWSH